MENHKLLPNKSLKGTAPTGAASQYCAVCVRFALRAPLSPLALRYAPIKRTAEQ